MEIALMISGNLGLHTFKFLHENEFSIVAVLTDSKSKHIVEEASCKNIPLFVGNPRDGKCREFITGLDIEVLISINYLFIVENDIIKWPSGLSFNIHGSLLPKYRGRTPHVWAIINNEKNAGITAHIIEKGCDTGDILEQIEVPIGELETGSDILSKYSDLYPLIVKNVLDKYSKGELSPTKQDESKATFFGKRVPEDGRIDWNWSKERIVNWIRAQSNPYPGAFSYDKGNKVIIDEVSIDDFGFSWDIPNGQVVSINPTRVKTPNGTLRINKTRPTNHKFSMNNKLL